MSANASTAFAIEDTGASRIPQVRQGVVATDAEHEVCRLLWEPAELACNMISGRSIDGQQRGFPARRQQSTDL